jgi:hypothetical protein
VLIVLHNFDILILSFRTAATLVKLDNFNIEYFFLGNGIVSILTETRIDNSSIDGRLFSFAASFNRSHLITSSSVFVVFVFALVGGM